MINEAKTEAVKRMKTRLMSSTSPRFEPKSPLSPQARGPAALQQLLTVTQAAEIFACSTRQVWRLIERKELDRVEIGGMTRTTLASVLKLIQRSKT